MSNAQDTEITLGTGKMLMLFFGLVALCAVFFGMGYSLGRGSGKPGASETRTEQPSRAASIAEPSAPAEAGSKPADFALLRASERKMANTPQGEAKAGDAAPDAQEAANKQPSPPDPATIAYSNPYYVQVAAVSKQEDAEALVDALKKKEYPAFTANGSATDKLYHVQVGPYGDVKDAEAMRGKLVSDGYSPILKK